MSEKVEAANPQAAIDFYKGFIGTGENKVELQMYAPEVTGENAAEEQDGLQFVEKECSHTESKEAAHAGFTAFISAWASYFFGVIKAIFTCSWSSRPSMPACYCTKLDKTENKVALVNSEEDEVISEEEISRLAFTILGVEKFDKPPEAEEAKGKEAKEAPKSRLQISTEEFAAKMKALKGDAFEAKKVTIMTTTLDGKTSVEATFTSGEEKSKEVKLVFTA